MTEEVATMFFEKCQREAWRGKSVKVALGGRIERKALRGSGDDESRHGQGSGWRWEKWGERNDETLQ